MLEIEFPNSNKVRAIIIDKPINGVSGIVECCDCDCRAGILSSEEEAIAQEIEDFTLRHNCEVFTTKQQLLDAVLKVRGE